MVKDFAKSYYTKTLGGESTEKAFPGFGEYLCPEIPKLPSEEVLQNNYKNDDLKNPAKK